MGFNPAFNMGGQPSVDGGGILPYSISGLQLWLDAADTSTIIESSGSVSQWNDKSGNGNNATQGSGSNQPTTGTVTQNGKNVIDFDGNDYLILPSALYSIPNGDHTIFFISKQDAMSAERLISAAASGTTRHSAEYTAAGNIVYFNNASFNNVQASINETAFNVIGFGKSGTTQFIQINNGTAVTDNAGTNISGIDLYYIAVNQLASSGFLDGNIAEIIIYNRALSAAEKILVYQYLGAKWGITLS